MKIFKMMDESMDESTKLAMIFVISTIHFAFLVLNWKFNFIVDKTVRTYIAIIYLTVMVSLVTPIRVIFQALAIMSLFMFAISFYTSERKKYESEHHKELLVEIRKINDSLSIIERRSEDK